jgi:hypothetical protein
MLDDMPAKKKLHNIKILMEEWRAITLIHEGFEKL